MTGDRGLDSRLRGNDGMGAQRKTGWFFNICHTPCKTYRTFQRMYPPFPAAAGTRYVQAYVDFPIAKALLDSRFRGNDE